MVAISCPSRIKPTRLPASDQLRRWDHNPTPCYETKRELRPTAPAPGRREESSLCPFSSFQFVLPPPLEERSSLKAILNRCAPHHCAVTHINEYIWTPIGVPRLLAG